MRSGTVETLSLMDEYQTWGSFDGPSLVGLTDAPVSIHPNNNRQGCKKAAGFVQEQRGLFV